MGGNTATTLAVAAAAVLVLAALMWRCRCKCGHPAKPAVSGRAGAKEGCCGGGAAPAPPREGMDPGDAKLQTYLAMRDLWGAHVARTRMAIISLVRNLPDLKQSSAYLMANQDDIGRALGGVFGAEAGQSATALLREHISIAVELVTAAKRGQTAAVAEKAREWDDNATRIAQLLASLSPAWGLRDMQAMMRAHLKATQDEAVAYIAGDYAASLAHYGHAQRQIAEMADMLAAGILSR